MYLIKNDEKNLSLSVNLNGGSISYFKFKNKYLNKFTDVFRSEKKNMKFEITKTACFPLVPFCNRINKNKFLYKNRIYKFRNNSKLGKYYLHGDGWLNKWQILKKTNNSIEIQFLKKKNELSPYEYLSRQKFILFKNKLKIYLSVKNLNDNALPFGLGLHTYYPMNELTKLHAKSKTYWLENNNFIPTKIVNNSKKMNFNKPSSLPNKWINNCFNNWNGKAAIYWPEKKMMLKITSSNNCKYFFLFVSDNKFEKNFKKDYFSFEPMTHAVNAHNLKKKNGLIELKKNQILKSKYSFTINIHND